MGSSISRESKYLKGEYKQNAEKAISLDISDLEKSKIVREQLVEQVCGNKYEPGFPPNSGQAFQYNRQQACTNAIHAGRISDVIKKYNKEAETGVQTILIKGGKESNAVGIIICVLCVMLVYLLCRTFIMRTKPIPCSPNAVTFTMQNDKLITTKQ